MSKHKVRGDPLWEEHSGGDPVIVTAIHSGHALASTIPGIRESLARP